MRLFLEIEYRIEKNIDYDQIQNLSPTWHMDSGHPLEN
jgi:hypothetical protein